jgi:hypothetical protein
VSLADLHRAYHTKVQFLNVYIREAHPSDGWSFGRGLVARVLKKYAPGLVTDIRDPQSIEERRSVAGVCEVSLVPDILTVVDDMSDSACRAYAAKPTRLYLVGTDGRVVYAGGLGPFGFKPAELRKAVDSYLATGTQ